MVDYACFLKSPGGGASLVGISPRHPAARASAGVEGSLQMG